MSTAIQDLEAAKAECARLNAAATSAQKMTEDAQALVAAHVATITELKATVEALNGQLAKAGGDLKAAEQLLAEQTTAHNATKDELAKAHRALANPAFVDAAMVGAAAPAAGGTPPPDQQPKTFAQWQAEYIKVRDEQGPKAAATFRAEHRKELGLE